MARSFHQNLAHIIFSTKNRDPLISLAAEPELHAPFKEEFVAFLQRHEVEYDERFIWE